MTSNRMLAKPVTTIPATHIPRANRVGKSLLNFTIGVSLLLINIAFTIKKIII